MRDASRLTRLLGVTETSAGSWRIVDGIIIHEDIGHSLFVHVKVVDVALFGQSATLEKPRGLVLRVLFQHLCANGNALVPSLPVELRHGVEKGVHIYQKFANKFLKIILEIF